jgi:hypothetical protein
MAGLSEEQLKHMQDMFKNESLLSLMLSTNLVAKAGRLPLT